MQLERLTATEAARRIASGETTSEALVAACLGRIEERDGTIGAWAHLDPDLATAKAREADEQLRASGPQGPLHGVPVGIKDIIDTSELPTENGTEIFKGRQPDHNASVVEQLRAAGAIVLGKTVTTELAFFGPGKTRNPSNPAHTPGGSSSGSAAAVADYHVPLALGTQTAGSVIRPASYCGCFGLKPTYGAISRRGILSQSPPLDTVGAYARSIEDLALISDCMMARDPADSDMLEDGIAPLRDAVANWRPGTPRFAFVRSPAWPIGDAQMHTAFELLAARLGAFVDTVDLPPSFETTGGLQRAVQFRDIAANYGPLLDAHPTSISAKLAEVIGEGRSVRDEEYRAALERRDALYGDIEPLFSHYDAILTPAAPGTAPIGLESTGSPAFNFLWTYLRMPAVSLPLLETGGMPLGVQLVGPRGGDGALLCAALGLEKLI
jgi:Asp-tRNA(Asn)/Glu-tRNA(Gln) amidotransferase A subunit family amidase